MGTSERYGSCGSHVEHDPSESDESHTRSLLERETKYWCGTQGSKENRTFGRARKTEKKHIACIADLENLQLELFLATKRLRKLRGTSWTQRLTDRRRNLGCVEQETIRPHARGESRLRSEGGRTREARLQICSHQPHGGRTGSRVGKASGKEDACVALKSA